MIVLRGTNRDITVSRCRFVNYGDRGISHLWDPKVSSRVRIIECEFLNGGATNVPGLEFDGAAISGIGSYWTIDRCTVVATDFVCRGNFSLPKLIPLNTLLDDGNVEAKHARQG